MILQRAVVDVHLGIADGDLIAAALQRDAVGARVMTLLFWSVIVIFAPCVIEQDAVPRPGDDHLDRRRRVGGASPSRQKQPVQIG